MQCKIGFGLCSALLLSTSLYAVPNKDGTGCSGDALCADRTESGLYGSITGNWFRPSETDIGMVTDSWQTTSGGVTTDSDRPFRPDHELEGSYTLGYDFQGSANGIEFNYFHLDNSSRSVNAFNGETLFTSYFFPGASLPPAPGFVSDANLTYKIDQADLKLTRKLTQFIDHFSVRPALGIRYAKLKHDLTFAAPGYVRSEFSGAGPMFSVDGSYEIGRGFSLIGYVDGALLVGETDANSYLNFGGTVYFKKPDNYRTVSNVNGRVGLNYTHSMNEMLVSAEVGYQASQYFNPFDLIRGNVAFAPGLVGRGINDIITTNFAVNGPYVKLGLHA